MGLKEDVLALAEDVESTIGGCYGCLLDKRGLCKAESDFDCNDEVCKFVAHRLRAIAENDAESVTTMSAYDLLPEDEREAIAWVREHGGLDLIKAFVHQGAVEHGFLLKIVHTLGTSIYDGTDNADALLDKLSKRLMPEGMEWLIESWPRFDDNEPARWEDEYENGNGNASPLHRVSLYADGRAMLGKGKTKVVLAPGQRVKRPAPKVLDADGVEICVGDTVYKLEDSRPYTVKRIDGEHVYINAGGKALDIWTFPGKLTHEQPDTWERIEEDKGLNPFDYCKKVGHKLWTFDNAEEFKAADLVRRCRALAERGE